jgi:drug/metabolite transporter (DMT)-like permease
MSRASIEAKADFLPALARWCVGLVLPLCALSSQICAKHVAEGLAESHGEWLSRVIASPWFGGMLFADVACFVAWMIVLGEFSLSAAFPMTAVSYVLVIAASVTLFHEPLGIAQIIGSVAILAGVYLISRSGPGEA